nr:transposase [Citrobacter koseri]
MSATESNGSTICRHSTVAAGRSNFAKKTRGAWRSVKYLGRYLKRPQVSAAKLRHYSGGAVVHHYYDHRMQQYRQQTLTQEEMTGRYISHVPAKHFKMLRYYGFCPTASAGNCCQRSMKPCRWRRGKNRSNRLRRADESVPAHRSVQMPPVRQSAAFC